MRKGERREKMQAQSSSTFGEPRPAVIEGLAPGGESRLRKDSEKAPENPPQRRCLRVQRQFDALPEQNPIEHIVIVQAHVV